MDELCLFHLQAGGCLSKLVVRNRSRLMQLRDCAFPSASERSEATRHRVALEDSGVSQPVLLAPMNRPESALVLLPSWLV